MNRIAPIFAVTLMLATASAPLQAQALPVLVPPVDLPSAVITVSGQCRAVAQQIAARHGGQLASVSAETRNGRTVCVGVVVVPAKPGQTGQTITFEEPL